MYDFHCPACGHDFEEVTPSAAPAPACPECGAATERLMSAPMTMQKHVSPKGKMWAERHKRNPPKPFK